MRLIPKVSAIKTYWSKMTHSITKLDCLIALEIMFDNLNNWPAYK